MKVARPVMAAVAVAIVLAVVFVVFALQLSSGQTRSRNELRTEVKDRAVLAASLIDSVFNSVQQARTQYTQEYSGAVTGTTLDRALTAGSGQYMVLTDDQGRILAQSRGVPDGGVPLTQSDLRHLAHSTALYLIGDFQPYGSGYTAAFALPFPTAAGGTRVLVTGIAPQILSSFFAADISSIPGVKGEVNYLVDGQGRVVVSSERRAGLRTVLTRFATASLKHDSGRFGGTYFQTAPLADSQWKIVLTAPDGTLFASVNGSREYVPWIIFAALVAVALISLLLGWRVLRSAELVKDTNSRLALVNSELSLANDALQRRAAELARSNEELESFASIASHDLQEPLRKVRTFTEQLTIIEADRLSDKGRDYLNRANTAAERMQKLIEDLLKFSRVSTQGRPFEPVDLSEVAQRVLVDLERQVEEAGASVEIGPLPVIAADPLQMHQLLQNLISNALKFREEGVTPVVRVSAVEDGADVRISVSDNGIGFEPRYAARIFRIFERLHGRSEYPGTGIGLALCRKIADRHGGTIEAESSPGHGATFTVTLPASQPDGFLGFGVAAPSEKVGSGVH